MELQSRLYSLLIGCFTHSESSIEDLLNLVLQSGNMCHSLCASPVDDAFSKMLLKHCPSSSDVSFWKSCAALNKSRIVLIFSVPQEEINELKRTALGLIKNAPELVNPYADAHIHYNLSERLHANGLYIEALYYAKEDKLLLEIHWGGTTKIKKFEYKIMHTLPSSVESNNFATNDYVPTSWNVVRCFLESALQTGILTELIGNRDEATTILSRGKQIANFLNLTLFSVSFMTALGKPLQKIGSLDPALQELESSQKSLERCNTMCCKKCSIVLEAQINQKYGDLLLSRMKISWADTIALKDQINQKCSDLLPSCMKISGANTRHLKLTKSYFQTARSKLEINEWKNSVSEPMSKTAECQSKADSGPDDHCWHYQPLITEELSLENQTYLQWECVRRTHLLHIHRKLAKIYKLEGETDKELQFLKSSIQVLVARSTFHMHDVPISVIESLLKDEVTAQVFGVEYASILYDICWFSLKYKDSRDDVLSEEGVLLGLQMAFILSREVRILHEKVSRLLAVLYASFSIKEESF